MSGHSVDVMYGASDDPLPVVSNAGVIVELKVGRGNVPVYVSVKNGIFVEVELLLDEPELVG
jgi:hypothetical protein